MKGIKTRVFLSGLAVLLLTLLFSCSWTPEVGIDGTNIVLNVGSYAPRAIGVTEYDVTGLVIVIIDPSGEPLAEFEWDPGDGATQYLIPVEQAGEHQVVVTHIGDGGAFEATESSFFDIQPMIITVITIVPGMIGVIQVEGEGGGEEPSQCEQLIGTWAGMNPFPMGGPEPVLLYTVLQYNPDGTAANLTYESEGGPILEDASFRGTYACRGGWVEGRWNEIYSTGGWVPFEPPVEWRDEVTGMEGDIWTMDVDFDQDGIPDATWTLHRQ